MRDTRYYAEKVLCYLRPLLVFTGVLAAFIGFQTEMELKINVTGLVIAFLIASYGMMFLYRYLNYMPGGRWLGLIAVGVLELVYFLRFFVPVVKGAQYVINSYLKQFIEYTHLKVDLLSYISSEESYTTEYCVTLFLVSLGILLIAIISFSFYTKRSILPFLICTFPILILPITVGNVLAYRDTVLYLFSFVIVIGTGTGKRQQEKEEWVQHRVAVILAAIMLICTVAASFLMTEGKYEEKYNRLLKIKISLEELADFSTTDFMGWLKANFGVDAIDYGTVGERGEVHYNGDTLVEIQSDSGLQGEIFLKGFIGDKFEDNQWKMYGADEDYYLPKKEWLADRYGVDPDNWDKVLIAQMKKIGESIEEFGTSVEEDRQQSTTARTMKIRNVGLGRGNRVLPYYAAADYKYTEEGKIYLMTGSSYNVSYYSHLAGKLMKETTYSLFLRNYYTENEWVLNSGNSVLNNLNMNETRDFIRRYYLSVPDKYKTVFQKFFDKYNAGALFYVSDSPKYPVAQDSLPEGYNLTTASIEEVIQNIQGYLAKEATYTLSPGATPDGEDAISYFMTKNKKGYCVHFASAATMLFRLCGIPARYAEGVKTVIPLRTTDTVKIEDSEAHAWVEIYRDDVGWIPVEVTPGIGNIRNEGNTELDNTETPESSPETPQSVETPTPTPEGMDSFPEENESGEEPSVFEGDDGQNESEEEVSEEGEENPSDDEEMEYDDIDGEDSEGNGGGKSKNSSEAMSPVLKTVLSVIGMIAAVLILLYGQLVLRRMIYQKRLAGLNKRNRIIRMFLHLRPLLRKYGIDYTGQSSDDYIRLVAKETDCSIEEAGTFVTELLKAEFGGSQLSTEDYRAFGKAYRKIRRKLFGKMPLLRRIWFRVVHG